MAVDAFYVAMACFAFGAVCSVVCFGASAWSSIKDEAAARLAWATSLLAIIGFMGAKTVVLSAGMSIGFGSWEVSPWSAVDGWSLLVAAAVFVACGWAQVVFEEELGIASRGEMAVPAALAAIPLSLTDGRMDAGTAVMLVALSFAAAFAVSGVASRLGECLSDDEEELAGAALSSGGEGASARETADFDGDAAAEVRGAVAEDCVALARARDAGAGSAAAVSGDACEGGDAAGRAAEADDACGDEDDADADFVIVDGRSKHIVMVMLVGIAAVVLLGVALASACGELQDARAARVDLEEVSSQRAIEQSGAFTVQYAECTVPYVVLDRKVRTSEVGSAASYWVAVDAGAAEVASLDSSLRSRLMAEDGVEPGSNVTLNLCDAGCLPELLGGQVESGEALEIMQRYRLSVSF